VQRLADDLSKDFLEAAPDAMVIVDPKGAIAFVNSQTEALFGYGRDELVGRPVEVLLPERFRRIHARHRDTYSESPHTRRMGDGLELFALRKDGTEFSAEVSLSPVPTRQGLFVSSAIRDVSERKAIERQLVEARDMAERADRAKSAFLAAASHDLRQPLQTLMLLSRTLSRTVPSDSRAAAAVASQAEALRAMSKLLNSLLDISKLESGNVRPDVADCAVSAIFAELRAEFASLAEAKGLELVIEDCDAVVRTDPTLLSQIVQNLLGNAIRYTREGWVRLRALSAAAQTVRIEVLDTGVGIPQHELALIFDEFYQSARPPGQAREGLGLGLSIVRRTADLLGHALEVTSTVGEGSCFAVSVPRVGAAAARERPQLPEKASAMPGGLVLVVDDDSAVADATALLLGTMDLEVMVAAGADHARRTLLERGVEPRLLICDYHLGTASNGVDAIAAIRGACGREIPAILVSGDTSSAIASRLEAVTRCHLLSKPVDADELMSLVERLLREWPR
jgi:PAS domain S-box-containing protein